MAINIISIKPKPIVNRKETARDSPIFLGKKWESTIIRMISGSSSKEECTT